MFKFTKQLFTIDKHPKKGLLAMEWVMVAYLLLTLLIVFFTYTKAENPNEMIWGRIRIAAMTAGMWAVYRMMPCRLTLFLRITVQLALLGWWYPDTYEINRMLPNLDHLFAQWEQDLFGCQPALLFCKAMPWPVVSELMSLGYAAYYPMIVVVVVYYFACRYNEYERAAFVVLAAFFLYYLIFIALPVTGPTFYYKAVCSRSGSRYRKPSPFLCRWGFALRDAPNHGSVRAALCGWYSRSGSRLRKHPSRFPYR